MRPHRERARRSLSVSGVSFLSRTQQVVHVALILLASLGAAVRPAAAASCTLQNLCSAPQGDCVVNTDHTCDSPASFDLGGRALVISGSTTVLMVVGGDDAGTLNITGAASVSLATGAKIVAQGAMGEGGQIFIASDGPVSLAAGSTIDVSSDAGDGLIQIDVQSGKVQVSGTIDARAKNTNGSGGIVVVTTDQAGDIVVDTGGIKASAGGDLSDGGSIDLEAGKSDGRAPVDLTPAAAATSPRGRHGNVVIAGRSTGPAAADGCSGPVDVTAGGDITLRPSPAVGRRRRHVHGGRPIDSNAGKIDATVTVPGHRQTSVHRHGAGNVTLTATSPSRRAATWQRRAGEVEPPPSGSVERGRSTSRSGPTRRRRDGRRVSTTPSGPNLRNRQRGTAAGQHVGAAPRPSRPIDVSVHH